MKKYFLEAIGTMFYVLIGCSCALMLNIDSLLAIAASYGTVFVILYILISKCTGCCLNPIVSFSLLLNKKIKCKTISLHNFQKSWKPSLILGFRVKKVKKFYKKVLILFFYVR